MLRILQAKITKLKYRMRINLKTNLFASKHIKSMRRLIVAFMAVLLLVACNALPSTTVSPGESASSSTEEEGFSSEGVLQYAGQIGGPTQAVAAIGNTAYVGVGSRVMVLDISTPNAIRELGSSESLGASIEGITIEGNTVYVAAGGAGIYIMDISDLINPVIVGNYNTPGYAEEITLYETYAFVSDGPAGLRIVDISDSSDPVEISSAYKSNYTYDTALEGNFAYIAAAGTGLLVVDITDPFQPKEIGALETHGFAYGITISENKAYIADGWEGIHILDISDPTKPNEIGVYSSQGWAYDVVVNGDLAYVADSYSGVDVLDISDAAKPELIGSFPMLGNIVNSLVLSAQNIIVASRTTGMSIIDISNPSQLTRTGLYNPMGYADSVAVSGNYAYVAAGPYGLRVIDISDSSYSREVGACGTQGYATGVVAAGDYSFVISYGSGEAQAGLHVIDVSDPYHPFEVAFCASLGMPQDIVYDENKVYIANEWGMEAYDVSNPASPVTLCTIDFAQGSDDKATDATFGIAFSNDIAYVTHGKFGLEIVDLSNPNTPRIIGNFNTGVQKLGVVTVKEKIAYISDGSLIRIVDVSDPQNPTEMGSYKLSTDIQQLHMSDNTLYAAAGAAGLFAIDVTDPHKPESIGWQLLPGYSMGLSSQDSFIYAADGEGGLFIVRNAQKAEQIKESDKPALNAGDTVYRYVAQAASAVPHTERHGTDGSSITIKVTSAADSGPGSLREAIESINKSMTYIIIFDPEVFSPEQPETIFLSSGLTLREDNVTIDASNAGVILDGNKAKSGTSAIEIVSDYNIVKGIQIINFPDSGISIFGSYNIIGGDRSKGTGPLGEGNLISGNKFAGINISGGKTEGSPPTGNMVKGNLIGTDLSGNKDFGNSGAGIFIGISANGNIIGGDSEAERNIISGNKRAEVSMMMQANRNIIAGNYIGTNISGNELLGNAVMGITMELAAYNNIIERNVINNNNTAGVMISDWGSWGNSVVGNIIGLDATGTYSVGGNGQGVSANASFNRIGGSKTGERNIISGNGGWGIKIGFGGTIDTIVIGNYIGTDLTGKVALGNKDGIFLYGGECQHTIIGGASDNEKNLIGGNKGDGIRVEGTGNDYNYIFGNYIGTDRSGTQESANLGSGINLDRAQHTFVLNNLIANNEKAGILIISGENNQIYYNEMLLDSTCYDESKNSAWDDGEKGNYWSNYGGQDSNGDGIGDTAYPVSPNGTDNYPLINP